MKNLYYYNEKTHERVDEEYAEDYALEQLGIKHNGKLNIIPKGKNNTLTLDQQDWLKEATSWYFDGYEWTVKYDYEIVPEDRDSIIEDMIYEENLDKRLMGE